MQDGKNLLIQEGTEGQTSNVSTYVNSGKYLCPYRSVKTNNLMYDAGYTWCEACLLYTSLNLSNMESLAEHNTHR